MSKEKQFRIGSLAHELGVESFVIRFWEKEFNIRPTRSEGGQRFYTDLELSKFKQIKTLLYQEGFTISGAKRALMENQPLNQTQEQTALSASPLPGYSTKKTLKNDKLPPHLTHQLMVLYKQLQHLKEVLELPHYKAHDSQ